MNAKFLLSKDILKISKKRGKENGWRLKDVPKVLEDAKNNNLANIGGQLQYTMPGGICELYWISIESSERKKNESWDDRVKRSYEECMEQYNSKIKDRRFRGKSFIQEAVESFEFLKKKKEEGVDLLEHEYFIMYFRKEEPKKSWTTKLKEKMGLGKQ